MHVLVLHAVVRGGAVTTLDGEAQHGRVVIIKGAPPAG